MKLSSQRLHNKIERILQMAKKGLFLIKKVIKLKRKIFNMTI
jgi:hypothetical protein